MKVIAFNGSARKQGNTAILIKYVLSELENEAFSLFRTQRKAWILTNLQTR